MSKQCRAYPSKTIIPVFPLGIMIDQDQSNKSFLKIRRTWHYQILKSNKNLQLRNQLINKMTKLVSLTPTDIIKATTPTITAYLEIRPIEVYKNHKLHVRWHSMSFFLWKTTLNFHCKFGWKKLLASKKESPHKLRTRKSQRTSLISEVRRGHHTRSHHRNLTLIS